MIKKSLLNWRILLISVIIFASFLAAFYFYDKMPDKMASHWGFNGEVNGYMSKFWGLFLMPILILGIFILSLVIIRIDPLAKNIEKFKEYFWDFILIICLFFFYVYLLTLFWNYEVMINIGQFLAPAFAILFFYAGVLIAHSKRNYSIGIRTPWTLADETVWNKTHKVGGILFKWSGVICLLGFLFPKLAFVFVLVPVIASAVISVVYSYVVFRKKGRK